MIYFKTIHTRRACGCITSEREELNWNHSADLEVCNLHVGDECQDCRPQIGQVVEFVRFGDPVEHSRNSRDNYDEPGMSCYLVIDGRLSLVGWHFGFTDRPAYRGTGELVGWGSDCEPLVVVRTIRKISRKAADGLVESDRDRRADGWNRRNGQPA